MIASGVESNTQNTIIGGDVSGRKKASSRGTGTAGGGDRSKSANPSNMIPGFTQAAMNIISKHNGGPL